MRRNGTRYTLLYKPQKRVRAVGVYDLATANRFVCEARAEGGRDIKLPAVFMDGVAPKSAFLFDRWFPVVEMCRLDYPEPFDYPAIVAKVDLGEGEVGYVVFEVDQHSGVLRNVMRMSVKWSERRMLDSLETGYGIPRLVGVSKSTADQMMASLLDIAFPSGAEPVSGYGY